MADTLDRPLYFILNDLTLDTLKYSRTTKGLNYFFKNYEPLTLDPSKTNSNIKSAYQPLKKGISNMIRIQADKAVAMPTDTRLQILAVSKDIIHSWSIPSAGIKIDCIPGYSSHRVAVFSLSGIY